MAEKLTLSVRDLLKIDEGLRSLDGVSNEAGKITRFDFESGLAWNIAKNQDITERALAPYNRAVAALQAKHGIVERMQLTEENAAAVATFADKRNELLDKSVEVNGILKLSRSDLQTAGVKIPGVLKNLMQILKDT